ncbi:MAG: metal-dependent transcriptional regulator [Chloroflexi bacterium]|nr:MAG: metal-dependent transcriptional regulator [Chloroflexota bacterium]
MKHNSFNESIEMYLKTVTELTVEDDPVSISSLADRLGVSTVSANEMVHRLKERGLLEHTPYKGVNLTTSGKRKATALIRSHHMWECFLVEKLNIPWEQAHDSACRLEHATDTAVTEALASFLNHPQTCPHGNITPDVDGNLTVVDDVPLTELEPGESGVISRIYPESTLLLEYLATRKLKPGRPLCVEEIAPFNGPIMARCCNDLHPLGQEVAAHIFIKKTETLSDLSQEN